MASIAKGMSANLLGGLAPMVVTLVVTPLYIGQIGLARFGVLSLVWLLLGYLGVFDLGFGRAVTSIVAKTDDAQRQAETFWTAAVLSTGSGVLGGAIALGVGFPFFGKLSHSGADLSREIFASLPVFVAILPLVTASSVLGGFLQGRQQFGKLNLAQTAGTVAFQAAPLLVAWFVSHQLTWLAWGALAGRLVGLGFMAWCCVAVAPGIATPRFRQSEVRSLLGFGGWVMMSGVVSQLMLTMDRVIIGMVMSAQAVAIYSIPYNIIIRATLIPYSWFSVLYPRFAGADEAAAKDLLRSGGRVLLLLVTPITVGGLVVLRPFLEIWIGRDIANQATPVALVLMASFWFYAQTFVPLAFFQARGRVRIPALIYLGEACFFVPLLFLAIHKAGLVGAAAAWGGRVLVDGFIMYVVAGQWKAHLINMLIGAPPVLIATALEFLVHDRPGYYLYKGALLLAVGVYMLAVLRSSERAWLLDTANRFIASASRRIRPAVELSDR